MEQQTALPTPQRVLDGFVRFLDKAPQPAFIKDERGRHVYVNPALRAAFGPQAADALGKTDRELWPAPFAEQVLQNDRRFLQTGEGSQCIEVMPREDGFHYWRASRIPIPGDSPDRLMLGVILEDITSQINAAETLAEQRRQAEEQLHQREADLADAQALGHMGSFRVDLVRGTATWSAEAFRIHGFDPALGIPSVEQILQSVHPEDRARVQGHMELSRHEARHWHIDFRIVRPDGAVRYLQNVGQSSADDQGRVVGFFGTVLDITDAKLAEQTLAEAEAKYRGLVEESLVGVYLIQEGRFVYVNACMAEVFGYRPDEVVGRAISDLVAAEDRSLVTTSVHQRETGQVNRVHYTFRGRHKDGRVIDVEVIGSRTVYNGRPAVIGSLLDITERKHAEEKLHRYTTELVKARMAAERQAAESAAKGRMLERSRAAAEAANRAKSDFMANMSHEIRTPMTAILGYSDMIQTAESPDERHRCTEAISRNARHLLGLINDILDISKIEAGKMTVEQIPCDLPQLVGEVVSMMRPRALEKRLAFDVWFNGSVPGHVHTDPLRLKQILVNLLGNAVKFTGKGGISLEIACQPRDGGSTVSFVVCDSGIGIPAEKQAKLFQPFTQADGSTTRQFGGTGLGLSLSRRLAVLLGGDITLESKFGAGSTFTVTVDGGPLQNVPMLEAVTEAVLPSRESPAARKQISLQGRILLAEDGPDNQHLISTLLKKAGAEVTIVDNGRKAVDVLQTQSFDLILMDMQMPELDGYGATRELRQSGCQTPIVALTAHAMAEDRAKCIQAGCTDYLSKPITRERLLCTASTYLPGSRIEPAPPVQATPEPPAADRVRSRFAQEPHMQGLLAKFVAGLPNRVSRLADFLADSNLDELRQAIHQIKGAGGGYGFSELTDLAAKAEQRLRDGASLEAVAAEVDALITLVRRVDGYDPNAETRKQA